MQAKKRYLIATVSGMLNALYSLKIFDGYNHDPMTTLSEIKRFIDAHV